MIDGQARGHTPEEASSELMIRNGLEAWGQSGDRFSYITNDDGEGWIITEPHPNGGYVAREER